MDKLANLAKMYTGLPFIWNGETYGLGRPLIFSGRIKFLVQFSILIHFRQPEVAKLANLAKIYTDMPFIWNE